MRSLIKTLGGASAGGSMGYGLSDGLDPIVPFLFVIAGCLFLAAAMTLLLEREGRRG